MSGVFLGSDEYINWLTAGIAGEDEGVMEQFLLDFNRYASGQLRNHVPPDEMEDVVMAADCALLTHIAEFLQRSGEYTPYQRQRWFKTLIRNTMLDYLEKNRFGESWRDRKGGQPEQERNHLQLLSWEEYTQNEDLSDGETLEDQVIGRSTSQVLEDLIENVCSLRGEPDSLLAFFYHNIVFFLASDGEKKGKPGETARQLKGKTLGELRDELPKAIQAVSGYGVSQSCFQRLDEKLAGLRDKPFTYDGEKISASASYIKKRVKARREP